MIIKKWPKARIPQDKIKCYKFTVYGNPVPYKAPHFTRLGRVYKQKDEHAWLDHVRDHVLLALAGKQIKLKPHKGPVILHLRFYLHRSKSQKKSPYHLIRPDTSNLTKLTEDALKGVIFHDDSQVITLRIEKTFADSHKERIEIECYLFSVNHQLQDHERI